MNTKPQTYYNNKHANTPQASKRKKRQVSANTPQASKRKKASQIKTIGTLVLWPLVNVYNITFILFCKCT